MTCVRTDIAKVVRVASKYMIDMAGGDYLTKQKKKFTSLELMVN